MEQDHHRADEKQPVCEPTKCLSRGPRGMSHELFNDFVMFHLLTAFPINAAEQEKYHITNVLNSLSAMDGCDHPLKN